MRFVPVKSIEQQSRLFVHRARQCYVEQRATMIYTHVLKVAAGDAASPLDALGGRNVQ